MFSRLDTIYRCVTDRWTDILPRHSPRLCRASHSALSAVIKYCFVAQRIRRHITTTTTTTSSSSIVVVVLGVAINPLWAH